MADPLFQTRNVLLQALRLSEVESAGTAQAVIDQGVNSAKVTLYRRLGIGPVSDLVAISRAEPPVTNDDILRLQAEQLEVMLVREQLLMTLPVLFEDASAEAGDVFQGEEPFTPQPGRIKPLLDALQVAIEEAFLLLMGETSLGKDETLNTFISEYDSDQNPTGGRIPANRFYDGGPLDKG